MDTDPLPKRRRTNDVPSNGQRAGSLMDSQPMFHHSSNALTRDVSPPLTKGRTGEHRIVMNDVSVTGTTSNPAGEEKQSNASKDAKSAFISSPKSPSRLISSPVQLTHVQGLSCSNNVNCPRLTDLIGNPLIKECWAFNYLFDVDFLLSNFDEDIRSTVQVKLVHGFWKNEDTNRTYLNEMAAKHSNVEHITAYLPEMFGTHHSKMFILLHHDDHAQVVIHTANLIPQDWRMCQAVWHSPLLPLTTPASSPSDALVVGSGARFKFDLMSYLRAYERSRKSLLKKLIDQITAYDFSAIRAAFIGSVPGRQCLIDSASESRPNSTWGWPGLKKILCQVPSSLAEEPQITLQVSSIASLGVTDKWLKGTIFPSLSARKFDESRSRIKPKFHLIFPTADEIRRSLDGYGSGGSIHFKTQGTTQAKQLEYLRPYLCHWAGDGATTPEPTPSPSATSVREAGRRRAAPHIKTYARFPDKSMTQLDWAMVTSANLSKQAWGAEANAAGEVRICSYEVGVVVWPNLFGAEDEKVKMVPVFKSDLPTLRQDEGGVLHAKNETSVVGLRMPFDLPLVPYAKEEMPWCASAPDAERDWMGRAWPGFGA